MDPELSKKWIIKSRKKYMLDKPLTHCRTNIMFCSEHFERDMFTDEKLDTLLPGASPTLVWTPQRISIDEQSVHPSNDEKGEQSQLQPMEGAIHASKKLKVEKFMFQLFHYFNK